VADAVRAGVLALGFAVGDADAIQAHRWYCFRPSLRLRVVVPTAVPSVFTDIEGSTRLLESLGDRYSALQRRRSADQPPPLAAVIRSISIR